MKHKKVEITIWYCDECPHCESAIYTQVSDESHIECSKIGKFATKSSLKAIPENCPLGGA